jgi:eukaryotic-like serine/threonine-protein kinase
MTLIPGTRLGPYEVQSPIGAGGMGEVYRARDTRLDRVVAIKILPQQLSNDPVQKVRFEREAKAISNLNHPHICVLYDVGQQDGTDYLVMECLEGETLADRLQKGPLPPVEVLKYGAQIADALHRAHSCGIVHRDLKPGNIMLTATGVKLLDFGLAKPFVPLSAGATVTAATQRSPVTGQGTIVGTFQYMSPEQIEGKELDGRSDIFAFGAVLYEMVTGQRAFQGNSHLSVISAILEKDPAPISVIKPLVPPGLDHAIRRCLAKNADERWQTARDLAFELKWVADQEVLHLPSTPKQKASLSTLISGVLVLLMAAVTLTALASRRQRHFPVAPIRFQIALPPGAVTSAISPDGRKLAIVSLGPDGRQAVWIRSFDSLEMRALPGTENVLGPAPFWSSDSRFIAFQAGTKLKKVDVSGGPPQVICDTAGTVLGGAWNSEDTIIFGTDDGGGIMQVPASGLTAPTLVTTTGDRDEVHVFPFFLRDGQHFAYLKAPKNAGIYIGSLGVPPEKQSPIRILSTSLQAAYSPSLDGHTGRLLFMRDGSLLTQTFDERRMELIGNPVLVSEQVGTYLLSANFSASANGVVTFLAGRAATPLSVLTWYTQQGKELSIGDSGDYAYADLALSPDGTRVAASRVDPKAPAASQRIWLIDLIRRVSTPFIFDLAPNASPVWSPDGRQVAFSAARKGGYGIYVKASDGTGREQTLVVPTETAKVPNSWSSDGRFLIYSQNDAKTNSDLWVLPLPSDGTTAGNPSPFASSEFNEGQGKFSPDTRWVAYTSDESGRPEIYVRPFPEPSDGGGKTRISPDGGSQPRWRRDGKELFYLSLDGRMMAVDVTEGSILRFGNAKRVFQVPLSVMSSGRVLDSSQWDVSSDGQRFLINKAKPFSAPLTVILNWTEELEKR